MTNKNMAFPTGFKCGAYDWEIELVDDLREKETGARLYGQCDPTCLTIRIHSDLGREQIRAETLWHEILHAIWSYFHLEEKVDEEQAVACLSTGIVMVMRDNPELKKYFWEIWR